MTTVEAGFADTPEPDEYLDWLEEAPGGVVQLVVTRARPPGLEATPSVEPSLLRKRAQEAGVPDGVHRVVLVHAEGRVPEGDPVAVVGVAADHREEGFEAVDRLLASLGGVATRSDLTA